MEAKEILARRPKFFYRCDLCGTEFQFGTSVYNGKHIPRYQINVCLPCYQRSEDGWAPADEEAVTRKLREQGKPIPARNAKGLRPRD